MAQRTIQMLHLDEYLKHHLRFVWGELEPTDEELNDDEYIQDTFINNAVNNEIYDFYEMWNDTTNEHYFEMRVDTLLILLNELKERYRDEMGDEWLPPNNEYTIQNIMNGWAYMEVQRVGIVNVRALIISGLEEEEEAEAEAVEIYNGTKDFPPNETDETCPICLEAYTEDNNKEGIRWSDHQSNCPHQCCRSCWLGMAKQQPEKYLCPICKRDITKWAKEMFEPE